MKAIVSLDLMEFIERKILPRYAGFDKAHGMEHVTGVILRSIEIARKAGADIDMAYTIAAYHDLGLSGPRAIHHITGGRILASDARLRRWFTPEQINVMKEAVEDHRASASHTPRSIYGRIVAEADRDLRPESVFRRTVQFGLANYPDMSRGDHWQRFVKHLDDKYSSDGYIHLWVSGSPNEERLRELRRIMADRAELRKTFDRIYDEETGVRKRMI